MSRTRVGLLVAAGLVVCGLAMGARLAPTRRVEIARDPLAPNVAGTGTMAPFQLPPRHPLSCKPLGPMALVIESAAPGAPYAWRLRLEARSALPAVAVTAWFTSRGHEAPPQTVWRGALARGETRFLDLPLAVPQDAVLLQAQAEALGPALMRCEASCPLVAGAEAPQQVSKAGRLLQSANGESVLEFTGHVERAR